MRYDLAAITRRAGKRRRGRVIIRDIAPPATLATDLFRNCYLPVIDLWDQALPGIEAEYARALSQMVTDSADDVQVRIDAADGLFQRLLLVLTGRLRDWSIRTETWQRGRWRGAVLSATGVDAGTLMGPEPVRAPLEAVVRRNVALIKDVSAQAQSRISDAVFRGLTQRRPATDVAKDIREAVAMGRARSRRIASHQLAALTSSLADERRRQAGITEWQWVHSGKLNPRQFHLERDGNVYTDDPERVGKEINGKKIMEAPEDRPGQLPACGCRSRSVIDLS